jgi:RNA 2',3'-cyclic 3'-phosphodiesterase
VRVFFAVPSDPEWVESARRLAERLRPGCPKASWTRPESWHLTLKFLGEISEDDAARFAGEAESAGLAEVPGGELATSGPVAFPARGRPRVLGVGVNVIPALERLWRVAERAAGILGMPRENRPFHPHVTLARVRDPWPASAVEQFRTAVGDWRFPAWRFSECVLFRSRLDPAGAVHTPLKTWELAGAAQETAS